MTTIQELIDSGEARGKAEGKAQGNAEGKAEAIRRLLVRRFGPLSPDVELHLTRADGATLDRWIDAVLDAESPEQLLTC